jgi:hypothetical protein
MASDFYNPFLIVELAFNGHPVAPNSVALNPNTYRWTTLPGNIFVFGNTYVPDHGLVTLEPPKLGNSLTKDTYTLKISDPLYEIRPYITNACGSARAKISLGFIAPFDITPVTSINGQTGNVTTTVLKDYPIAEDRHVINIYSGIVDSAQYIVSEETGIILEIRLTSPLGVLDASNNFYATADMLQRRVPNTNGVPNYYDTSFDNVSLAGKIQEIRWGRSLV